METKRCGGCRITKPVNEFNSGPKGLRCYCHSCNRKQSKAWYAKHGKAYYARPEVKERRARDFKKYKQSPAGRFKINVRKILQRATKCGKIQKKSCAICDCKEAQGHHPDYLKPLCVIWLCHECHSKHHRKKGS